MGQQQQQQCCKAGKATVVSWEMQRRGEREAARKTKLMIAGRIDDVGGPAAARVKDHLLLATSLKHVVANKNLTMS